MAENKQRKGDEITSAQIADLSSHFESLNPEELLAAYKQTIQDSQGDSKFGYSSGGNPSNTPLSIALLQDIMERRGIKY